MNNFVKIYPEFTDLTLIEAEGEYNKCVELFNKDNIKVDYWMLETDLQLQWKLSSESPIQDQGILFCKLHYFSDKKVLIMDYNSANGMLQLSRDIEILSQWVQELGWNRPEAHIDLIKNKLEFWKHYWETYIIDSPYFESKYGERENINYADNELEQEDIS